MRILFLSAWYPHRYDPMAGLFVRKHAEAVSRCANDVRVLYIHPDDSIKKTEIVIEQSVTIKEYIVYFPFSDNSIWSKVKKTFNYFSAFHKGLKALEKENWKPDIIQANIFTRTVFIAYLIKQRYKTPYTVIEHWTRYFRENTFRNLFHRYISIFLAKRASSVMPVTKHLQQNMEKHGLKNYNYQIINNVVNDNFFIKKGTSHHNKIKILNVTCFDDAHKNISGILRTVKELNNRRADFHVTFIGTGIDFEQIVNYAKELGVEKDTVSFLGLVEGENLVKEFQECDFTLLFSNYENAPVVISESLACGKPVISTDVGGINEHIDTSNGILIPRGDEKALEDALDHMLDHFHEYDAEKISKKAYEMYSFENVGKYLVNIYKSVL